MLVGAVTGPPVLSLCDHAVKVQMCRGLAQANTSAELGPELASLAPPADEGVNKGSSRMALATQSGDDMLNPATMPCGQAPSSALRSLLVEWNKHLGTPYSRSSRAKGAQDPLIAVKYLSLQCSHANSLHLVRHLAPYGPRNIERLEERVSARMNIVARHFAPNTLPGFSVLLGEPDRQCCIR
jgi:hypothetical protein